MNKHSFLASVSSLLSIMFFASLIEAFTYSGFLMKHFSVLVGAIFLFLTIVLFLIFKKLNKIKLYKIIIMIFIILAALLYLSMNIIESATYKNYVFSHFHIHPELLLSPLIFLVFVFSLNEGKRGVRILLSTTVFFVFVQYLASDVNTIKNAHPLFILRNLSLNYDQKMGIMMGKLFYNYAIFIKNNTPEDSVILIPPKGFPWPQTGNVGYLRYLLFPRKLINGNEKDSRVNLDSVDYVLIDYGETTISEYGFTNVWPKFNVDGEYIIYWYPADGSTQKVDNKKYIYEIGDKKERWGIIKVKK